MRSFILLLIISFVFADMSFGQSVSATYSVGDIPTNLGSYSATCNGAATPLVVTLPSGTWQVTSVDVAYDMTAQNSGYMSDQKSQIACQESGTDEGGFVSGTGGGGTQSYLRTGLTFANGVFSGNLTFELQAYRTWGGSDCNTTYNIVNDGTWIVTVYYESIPTFTVDFTADVTSGAIPLTTNFSSNVSPAGSYTYAWNFGDGTTSTEVNPTNIYTVVNDFDVSLTVTKTGDSESVTVNKEDYITTSHSFTVDFSADVTVGVPELNVSFTSTVIPAGTYTYVWDFGDESPTSSLSNPAHAYSDVGYYDVSLTVTKTSVGEVVETQKANFISVLPFLGSGTEADPFLIETLTDLHVLSSTSVIWDKYFKLTANINASGTKTDPTYNNGGEGFSPIGNTTVRFTGSFDGNEYVISNLTRCAFRKKSKKVVH